MSDPGRITSNPHKVAQWKARWRCEQDGHIWDGSTCARCGQRVWVEAVDLLANFRQRAVLPQVVVRAALDFERTYEAVRHHVADLTLAEFAKLRLVQP